MGAWGTGTFDHDSALDFLQVVPSGGPAALRGALDAVLEPGDYLDVDEAPHALAAAELVCARVVADGTALPNDALRTWLRAANQQDIRALVPLARAAVERVLGPESELRELWEETQDAGSWREAVERLLKVLSRPAASP